MNYFLFFLISYLIGSVSFAVLISRAFKLPSPYAHGSGNPGATNVLRTGNRVAALLTLIGDALKGAAVIIGSRLCFDEFGLNAEESELLLAISLVGVFLGHIYPIFHRFRGGKGVATAVGGLMALSYTLGLASILVWLIVAIVTRYSSLAAILSSVMCVLVAYFIFDLNAVFYSICIVGIVLISRHSKNIRNLLSGRESKIGSKS
ncbi:MAG: glycerol-3-phosphate 1-O-acyltransferase PlsY [Betaproteobacteria bacterium]